MKTLGLALVSLFAGSAFAQQPTVNVSFSKGAVAPDEEVSVRINLVNGKKPGVLPPGSTDQKAFYQVCSTKSLTVSPALHPEAFCTDPQTKVFQSGVDDLPGFTAKTGEIYTFKEPFKIPTNSPDQRVWVLVTMSFRNAALPAGFNYVRYGSTRLTRHCETSSSKNKATGKVACAYYTDVEWGIKKGATSVKTGTPVSPKP